MRQLKLPAKYCIIFSLLLMAPVWAETFLSDVPQGHWANQAVYELVSSGAASGFPDGTFKGDRPVTRNEMASFLSRFANSFNRKNGAYEKLLAEIKAEIALQLHDSEKTKLETSVDGMVESWIRGTSQPARGGKFNYRLITSLAKTFDPNAKLKINLDTMDTGYNTAVERNLPTQLIDLQSDFNWLNLAWKWTVGPGNVMHLDDRGLFPSENNMLYPRPNSAIEVKTILNNFSFSSAYVARKVAETGKIGVNEFNAKIVADFGKVRISIQPRYVYIDQGAKDVLAEGRLDFLPDPVFETNLLLAAGDFSAGKSGMYVKFTQQIKNIGDRGTYLTLRLDKVGSKYRVDGLDKYEFVDLNYFSRYILDGSVDLGVNLKQALPNDFVLEWISDYVTDSGYNYGANYPGTYYLWQVNLDKNMGSLLKLSTFYRAYNVPSGIAQFGSSAPSFSDMFGIGAVCSF